LNEKLLTPDEASDLLGVSRETLRHWRRTGYGPPAAKSDERKIRYPEGPLKAWIRCHTRIAEDLGNSADDTEEVGMQVA